MFEITKEPLDVMRVIAAVAQPSAGGIDVFVGAVRDSAIVCAASAPHRAEAFRACRKPIDEIKARVPIWKREHGPHGRRWTRARCSLA